MSVTIQDPSVSHEEMPVSPQATERPEPRQEARQDHERFEMLFEGGITKYIEPLLIYKRYLIGSLIAAILLAWAVLVLMPRSYASTGKLQLLVGRESVGLDPSSTTSQTMLMQKTPEEDVNSALEILGSRAIAEEVVDELGVDSILSGFLPSAEEPEPPGMIKNVQTQVASLVSKTYDLSGLRDKVSSRERAVARLQKKISVYSPKKSSTLIIEAEAASPQMAQAIVKSMIDKFLERHVNVATTHGSLKFFKDESAVAEKRLKGLLDQRKEILQKEKISSVQSKYAMLDSQLTAIEAEILKAEAQLKRTRAEIENIETNLKQIEPEIVSVLQTQPDVTMSNKFSALFQQAELEESRLSKMYQNDHPKLMALREQIEAARKALDQEQRTSDSVSKSPNPTWLKLQADLLKARTTFAGLDSFLQQNLSQRQSKQDEINRLLEFDNKLREMDREIEVASKSLATLKEKEEQSRVIEGLRQQRISSVSVAQPPSFVEKPVSPKKPVLALGFVSLGCLMGVGLTYLREFTRKTIRRPEEVERMLKYPVLTEVADLRALSQARETNEQTLRSRRCGRLLEACQGIQSELMLNLVKSDDSLRQARRIGVIGVTDGCGASSIAMALAMACADHDGQTTTLIDLDAKKGTVSKGFGLAHNTDSGRTRRRVNPDSLPAQRLTEDGLNLIGCKSQPGLVLAQGDAEGITRTLDELGRSSEFIIIDFPPANRFSNSLAVAQQLDQIIVVIASDQTEAKPAMKLIQQLEHAKADVVGVVVNKSKRYVARWIEGILG